ncbi:MAG: SRPBCC family protein [Verrucomicrobiales bacterium]|nr:SRPBCC family protein [Verrucomicrobiales bacterium]MCP5556147.1 SRPBCC family protein [Verrucomicrobiaceae bacterium]
MIKKILLGLVAIITLILVTAAFKSPDYRVERSRTIAAKPEVLFDYFNNHKKFNEWNPFTKMDPSAKNTYTGPESGVGAVASWVGEKTGEGSATITESKPGELIRERMDWKKPMEGVSTAEFTFKPEGDKTTVTWAMYGKNGYMGKLMSVFMDCETMCGPMFESGLADLDKLVTNTPVK